MVRVLKESKDFITPKEAANKFVVHIYNKRVSVLQPYNNEFTPVAFAPLKPYKHSWPFVHTASATAEEVISRAVANESYEVHVFDTLTEFAQAVLDNGWKFGD